MGRNDKRRIVMHRTKKVSPKSKGANVRSTSALDFPHLAETITRVDTALRGAAAASVNRMLTMRNWLIGMYIVEYEQNGSDRAAYGENLIPRLAERLNHARGFSGRNLRTFREFYREYPKILQSVTAELSSLKIEGVQIWQLPTAKSTLSPIWQKPSAKLHNEITNQAVTDIFPSPEKLIKHFSFSHFVEIMRISDPLKRAFYEIEGIKGCWSVPQLKRQIESLLYERTGMSKDKAETRVKYATAGMDNQLFVSKYLTALPSEEKLLEFLRNDRDRTENVLREMRAEYDGK
jgi:hypothetical protein